MVALRTLPIFPPLPVNGGAHQGMPPPPEEEACASVCISPPTVDSSLAGQALMDALHRTLKVRVNIISLVFDFLSGKEPQ